MDWEDNKDETMIVDNGWQITSWTRTPRQRYVTRGAWTLGIETHSVIVSTVPHSVSVYIIYMIFQSGCEIHILIKNMKNILFVSSFLAHNTTMTNLI